VADAKCLNILHKVRLEPGIVQVFGAEQNSSFSATILC